MPRRPWGGQGGQPSAGSYKGQVVPQGYAGACDMEAHGRGGASQPDGNCRHRQTLDFAKAQGFPLAGRQAAQRFLQGAELLGGECCARAGLNRVSRQVLRIHRLMIG